MNSKIIKNIIIGVVLVIALFLIYIFFIKKGPATDATLTSSGAPVSDGTDVSGATGDMSQVSKDFVSLLLSVKSIKLDDSLLKNPAFVSLQDSSIILTQDGNEGRLNPFAPIGSESVPTTIPDANTNVDTGITGTTDATIPSTTITVDKTNTTTDTTTKSASVNKKTGTVSGNKKN